MHKRGLSYTKNLRAKINYSRLIVNHLCCAGQYSVEIIFLVEPLYALCITIRQTSFRKPLFASPAQHARNDLAFAPWYAISSCLFNQWQVALAICIKGIEKIQAVHSTSEVYVSVCIGWEMLTPRLMLLSWYTLHDSQEGS